jgi:oleandomycin transport system ATP-binding protein
MLATLLRPDAGTARVGGFDAVNDAARVRTMIGLTGQYAAVDEDLTGFENLGSAGPAGVRRQSGSSDRRHR